MKPAILAVLCAACWFVTAVNSQACADGDLRIQNGPSDQEGRPEICKGTVYYQICDDGWSQNDANVFCGKLGYSALGRAQAYGSSKYGSTGTAIDNTNYNCAGTEASLGACPSTTSDNCGTDHIAGVMCTVKGQCETAGHSSCCTSGCNAGGCWCDTACHGFGDCCDDISLTCPSSDAATACTTNEVRAVDGYTDNDGRVEYCVSGEWTTVCNDDNSWGVNEARVACAQLGITITNPIVYTGPVPYGQGDYGITVKGFDCVGTETGLNSCSKTLDSVDCGHQNDVGVDCNGPCTTGSVLLVGEGSSTLMGQVLYCSGGSYQFISDNNWGSEEAQVICGAMGYSTNKFNAYGGTTYGSSGITPTLNFDCDGDEDSLSGCTLTTVSNGDVNNVASVRCYETTICENAGHTSCCISGCSVGNCYCDLACHGFGDCCAGIDATCPASGTCSNGDVRLVDGPSDNEGRVEVCLNGNFGPVCDNKWGSAEAELVCNQLGYPTTDAVATTDSFYSQSNLTFVGGGFVCAGDEDTLAGCTQDEQWSCGHANEAGVRCPVACNVTGSIRLVGGEDAFDGRVEICEDDIWKSICQGTQWSQEDATVVCNQLNLATTAVTAYGNSYYGQGIGPIAASNLQCTGSESNIYDCTNSSASSCDHTTDVGVDCTAAKGPCSLAGFTSCCTSGCNQGGCYCDAACYVFNDCCSDIVLTCPQSSDASCTDDDIRLSSGDNANKGLVELCIDGEWSSICDDGWDNNDAAVACNQAGFSTVGALAVPGAFFGQDGGSIKKGNFQCDGTESDLVSCTSSDSTCAQHKIAGVVCPEECTVDGSVRLVGGSDSTSGYVEVCTGGSWTAICDDGWCQDNAKVVCGQLGFSTNNYEAYGQSYFGQDVAPIQYTNVVCDGDESSIVSCTNSSTVPSTCNSQSLAGVQCFEKSPCEASFDSCCSSGCNLGGCYCDLACHGFGDCCDNIDNICPLSSTCTNGLIRISGGQDEYEGLLEICVEGKWGTVCNDGFSEIDAVKACSQLKLPTDNVHVYEGGYLGQGTNPVVASGFLCSSQELNLKDCGYETTGFCCGHQKDVGIRCTPSCDDGEIRLDYGSNPLEGTVKVCINGGFKAVCDDQWSNQDATVVCRQLEYSALDAHSFGHSIFNNASSSTAGITNVVCDGTESSWLSCDYSDEPACGIDSYAGVRCSAATVGSCEAAGFTSCCTFGCNAGSCYCDQICHFFQDCCEDIEKLCPNDVECTEGEVRIVNDFSEDDFSGRVEVCINGKWGSICDDGWGINEAHVVCAQFGFTDYGSVPVPGAAFGQSSFQIVGSNFTCSGFEDSVYDCTYSPSPDCGHHEDAGVYCNVPCSEGDVRMVNSTSKYEGRVEVCNNGTWHPVCEESWSTEDAQVVCRHFGFSALGAQAYGNSLFGMGVTPTSFVGYNCTGSETNLTDCMTIPATMCDSDNTAGVRCSGDVSICEAAGHTGCCISGCNAGGCFCDAVCHTFGDCCDGIDSTCPQATCTNGDVRLINGINDYRGRVETCVDGQWGTVCDNGWDDNEARTICGQLGYPINGAAAKSEGYFGQGDGDIVAGDFQCTGSEDTILDCGYTSNPSCGHQEDAGVICPESCTTLGEMRFADGSSQLEGRIEMCIDYQWSSLCGDDVYCSKSASVLCKQMGYSPSNAEAYGLAKFGEGGGLVGFEALNCLGTEDNITQCQYTSGSSCSHAQDAGIVCKPLSPCELAGHTSCCTSGCFNSQFFCYCDAVCHIFNDCCDNIEATCPGTTTCTEGDKRLSKGNDTSGILYVCAQSQWKTVCGINFGDEEAKVACRSQGLDEKGFNILDVSYYGQGEGNVFAKDIQCTGDESYLTDCPGNDECCSHNKDVGLTCMYACVDGEVRLVGGDNANEGRVEVCYGGRWGTVCDDFWGEDEARVACKMAGLPWRGAVATNLAYFGQGVGPIHLDNVDCDGTEGTLWNCSHILTDHNCAHFEDAGAICAPGPCELSGYTDSCCDTSKGNDCQGTLDSGVCHCDPECELHDDCCVDFDLICKCEDNDIRLINGANEKEGRVEICSNGEWGTVCDDFFGIPEGQVICRQLGYPNNTVQTFGFSYFGQGTGPIWLDNLNCIGNESQLIDCPHLGIGNHNCIHFEDAGVRCADPQCTDGETRLVDGDSQYAGRLEVCLNKQWGSVCDDLFGNDDAKVACKSANLPYESAFWFRSQINFPAADSSLPINLDNVQCTGDEDHILDCPYVAQHNCIHFEDVAVVCNPSCNNGDLRLAGGTDETNGRLEVCLNKKWGTVCDDFFDNVDAKVACRQLGLPSGSARSLLNLQYGRGYGDINYSQLGCTGNETHLANCSKLTTGFFCSHAEDVAISCEAACEDGQIKLAGGEVSTEGRVEVCREGYWGTICDNSGYFGIHEARVVCRQLGFPVTAAQVQSFGPGGDPLHFSNLNCDGSELNIASCSKVVDASLISCTHVQDVGVTCEEACSNGDVRLVDGLDETNGRFEICLGGTWGTVCDEEFHNIDAKIVCKQLGLEYAGAEAVFGGVFGVGDDSIAITTLHCEGSEDTILDCFYTTGSDVSTCSHANDVAIICQGLCLNGDLRLVDGTTSVADAPPSSGRVEVCFNGEWGTVCDNGWSTNDAQVTCGQLGYDNQVQYVRSFGANKYGAGIGNIFLTALTCTGSESCLVTCPYETDTSTCTHNEDAGVRCNGEFDIQQLSSNKECTTTCKLPPPGAIPKVNVTFNPVEIRWDDPAVTNGIITGYNFTVANQPQLNRFILGSSPKYITYTGLSDGVPYTYSVYALNLCGGGPVYTDTFFTGELAPNSPTITKAMRIRGKSITVSWMQMTLAQARGNLIGYEVSWASDTSSATWSSIELSKDDSSYTIQSDSLEVDKVYQVRLRARNSAGYGDYSTIYKVNTTDSVLVQVKLFLQSDQLCGTWLEDSSSTKTNDLVKEIADQISTRCGSCGFTVEYLVGAFQCNPDDQSSVHFRGQLFTTSSTINPTNLAGNITDWLTTQPKVTVDGVSFDVDNNCKVIINTPSDDYCVTSSSAASASGAVVGASVAVVIVVIIVFAGLVIVIVILVRRVRGPGKYGSGDASHEIVGYSNQMAFPDGGEDNISQRASSTIHDDDFQHAINMISDEVDEKKNPMYDEPPSGITFSGDRED